MESLKINEEKINVNTEADSPREEAGRDIKISPLAPFFAAFIIFIITVLPFLIKYKGIWIYYGDFNVQQIPFYIHLHDVIRSGNIWYDWGTDLGGSVVGCYSFYILGSPFFWLTIPFKSETVIYLLPWINALKYGVMALTSYLWLRRNTKSDIGAFAGAMLYTFSGYSGAVLVYNHFHDVCAFFPLWLLAFDRLMQEKKRIGFVLMTGFMAVLNYYFFVGEAVFLIIYFFCRYFYDGNPGAIKRGFARMGRALYCSIAGVLCAAWYLIPAITYTLGNSRLSDTLMGNSLVAYDEPVMLLGIIKNVMLLPDLSGLNSMFNAGYSRVSGIGGYLPMVSLSCVIAYFIIYKKKQNRDGYEKWPARLTVTALIFAVIPGLNALFSALNSEYYARWYFMPVLVMSLMSALVLEDAAGNRDLTVPLLKGNTVVAVMIAFFCICAVLPAINDDGERTILGALKNPDQLLCQLVFSIIMTFIFFIIIWFVLPKSKKGVIMACTILLAAMVTHATMFVFGESLVDEERKQGFIAQGIKGADDIVLPNEDVWCRIETEQDVYNYPMIWNRPTITAFISTTSSGTMDFYHGIGLNRKVTSKLGVTRAGARTLFAGRYFLVENGTFSAIERIGRVEDEDELTNFTLVGECNGFDIYENNYFVPMGIVLDEYIKEENFVESKASSATLDRLLMKALILDDKAAEEYGYLLKEINQPDSISIHKFAMICDERCETACDSFTVNKKGFDAHINMEEEKLVLFAVPSDPGFKAYIDGNETPIITVDFGLMAVCVPKGEHDISFEYTYGNVYRNFADRFLLNKK